LGESQATREVLSRVADERQQQNLSLVGD